MPEDRGHVVLHAWPRLLDVHLAAAYLGLSASTVRDYVHAGLLQPVGLPGSRLRHSKATIARPQDRNLVKLLFDRKDLDLFVDQRKEEP